MIGKSELGGQTYFKVITIYNFLYFHIHAWRGPSLTALARPIEIKKSLEMLCKTTIMRGYQNYYCTIIFKMLIYLGFQKKKKLILQTYLLALYVCVKHRKS